MRCEATVGNLGWNTTTDVLAQRLKDLFKELHVDPTSYKNIHSDRDKGSRLYVTFLTPQERQLTQAKIPAVKSQRLDETSEIWR